MSEQGSLPDERSWDRFWSRTSSRRFGQRSWAKQRVLNVLDRYLPNQARVLDAGCGSGFFSAAFHSRGLETIALDYSPEALAMARELAGETVTAVQADLVEDRLDEIFSDMRFSLIFSDGLLEHFDSTRQKKILMNMRSVLEPDGVVVTFVPNRWSPWQIIRPLFMPGIQERPFVLPALRQVHEQSGLSILESGGVNVFPFRFSPEFFGPVFGMLLYVIARKGDDA